MDKLFHWTNTFKTLSEDDDGSVNIRGLASTNSMDRVGDVIKHDAWTKSGGLENFEKNPTRCQTKMPAKRSPIR